MLNITDEMQRFLITTTFGYDLKADDPNYNKLKKACFKRAYLDLARVIPYKYSVSMIDKFNKNGEKEDDIVEFKQGKKEFFGVIGRLLMESSNADNSGEIISSVVSVANNTSKIFNDEFTYGMAQKWVNMYFKYLWLFFGEKGFPCDLGIPAKLDMPIDSYIIDALFEKCILTDEICNDSSNSSFKDFIITKNKRIKDDKRPSESVRKWSGWDEGIYSAVQDLIKKECAKKKLHILQFENELWMEQAIKKINR